MGILVKPMLAFSILILQPMFGFVSQLNAEAPYTGLGYGISAENWVENTRCNPMSYFLYERHCKIKLDRMAKEDVTNFFIIFNKLITSNKLDWLDSRIVERKKLGEPIKVIIHELEINKNTYYLRVCKIRELVNLAYKRERSRSGRKFCDQYQ